jgi:hypothetical protein
MQQRDHVVNKPAAAAAAAAAAASLGVRFFVIS